MKFVDDGCGDFRAGHRLLPLRSEYIGVDVVERLTRPSHEWRGDQHTRLRQLDAIDSDPPSGDDSFLRMVDQRLSNEEIPKCFARLTKCRLVHFPGRDRSW